jgi:hypothetical protein
MDKVKDKILAYMKNFMITTIAMVLIVLQSRNLGGRIAVESKINEGATFTISFKY